jgi:hypothetical protein
MTKLTSLNSIEQLSENLKPLLNAAATKNINIVDMLKNFTIS